MSLNCRTSKMARIPDGSHILMGICHFSTFLQPNHDTAEFDPVHFDDQEHIRNDPSLEYSPDGKLLACWSPFGSHV